MSVPIALQTVEIIWVVSAPRERVYRAWREPGEMVGWLCEEVGEGAELELRWPSLGQGIVLRVLEEEAPGRLGVEAEIGGAVQTQWVELEDRGDGSTLVRIRHSAQGELLKGIASGWKLRMYLLEQYLERGGRRRVQGVMAKTSGEQADVYLRMHQAARELGLEVSESWPADALVGKLGGDLVYALRRFTLAGDSQLIAGHVMTWDDDVELADHQNTIEAVVKRASGSGSSTVVH